MGGEESKGTGRFGNWVGECRETALAETGGGRGGGGGVVCVCR